jgi:hypothetical protein
VPPPCNIVLHSSRVPFREHNFGFSSLKKRFWGLRKFPKSSSLLWQSLISAGEKQVIKHVQLLFLSTSFWISGQSYIPLLLSGSFLRRLYPPRLPRSDDNAAPRADGPPHASPLSERGRAVRWADHDCRGLYSDGPRPPICYGPPAGALQDALLPSHTQWCVNFCRSVICKWPTLALCCFCFCAIRFVFRTFSANLLAGRLALSWLRLTG